MDTDAVFADIKSRYSDTGYISDDAIIVNGNSLTLLKQIPDHSIALILTDPPYHSTKKKNIIGDTMFSTDTEYLAWLESFAREWKRVLKYNGSIFCFCSPAMSARLQVMFSRYFNVLTEIIWTKPNAPGYDGWKQKTKIEALRQWYPQSERILFMESAAEGNLFHSYFGGQLTAWRKSVGLTTIALAERVGAYGKVNHGGAVANWEAGRNIPNKNQFEKIKAVLLDAGVPSIPEYEDIIRPFNVARNMEFTDIWNFETVRAYKGKHPAEKPVELLEHAIRTTTYKGDIVLDCFAGSGMTGAAARNTGRKTVLFEIDPVWHRREIELLTRCFF